MSRHRFLQAAARHLEETGEHPQVVDIDRRLESWADETSARHEAARLPRTLGTVKEGRVFLFVRGVEQAEPGSAMLERFPAGLREARLIFRDRKEPLISIADLIRSTGMSESVAWQVLRLLEAEKLATKVRTGVCEVLPTVRRYRSVRTVEDYLVKKRAFERRRCWRATFRKPLDLMGRAVKREGPARKVIISAAGILLATLVLWIGKELTSGGSESPPHHHPPSARVVAPSRTP